MSSKASDVKSVEVKPPFREFGGLLQRKCACSSSAGSAGTCEECDGNRERLQRRATGLAKVPGATDEVESVLQQNGDRLDDSTRAFMESRFGHDFSKVRMHTDAGAAASARSVNALAYTVGQHVVFASGHYQPQTHTGRHLIAHELTHTIQQEGRPRFAQSKLEIGDASDEFEEQADRLADRVMKGGLFGSAPALPPPSTPSNSTGVSLIQRAPAALSKDPSPTEVADPTKGAAVPGLIVEDDAPQLAAGAMHKSEFLDELRAATCAAADAELARVGRNTESCPFISRAFERYRTFDSRKLERGLRRYAPEASQARTAREYISAVSARVSRAVGIWATTGEITGVPEELAGEIGMPGLLRGFGGLLSGIGGAFSGLIGGVGKTLGGIGRLFFKARTGGVRELGTSQADVASQIGAGQPLDGGVRSRMEGAFGFDFSRVRVHADGPTAELSRGLNARAFTVGRDVGFAAGEYNPGTVIGDALIAHELAHVIQQGDARQGTSPALMKPQEGADALEDDADAAAVGAVASTWGGLKRGLVRFSRQAMPRLKSGLQLQRCSHSKKEVKAPTKKQERVLTAEEVAHNRFRSEKLVARSGYFKDAGDLLRAVSSWASTQQKSQDVPRITAVVNLDPTQKGNLLTAIDRLNSALPTFQTKGIDPVLSKLDLCLTKAKEAKRLSGGDELAGLQMKHALNESEEATEDAISELEKLRDSIDGYDASLDIAAAGQTIRDMKAGKIELYDGVEQLTKTIGAAKKKLREAKLGNDKFPAVIGRVTFIARRLVSLNDPSYSGAPSAAEAQTVRAKLTANVTEDFQLLFGGGSVGLDFQLYGAFAEILEHQIDIKKQMADAGKPAKSAIPTQAEAEEFFKTLATKSNKEVADAFTLYAQAYFHHRVVTSLADMRATSVEDLFAGPPSITGTRAVVCTGYALLGARLLTLAGATFKTFIEAVRATDTNVIEGTIDEAHELAWMTRKGKNLFISNHLVVDTEDEGIGPDAVAWDQSHAPCYKTSASTIAAGNTALGQKLADEVPKARARKKPRSDDKCK